MDISLNPGETGKVASGLIWISWKPNKFPVMSSYNIRKVISLIVLAALAIFLARYVYEHHGELADIFRRMEFIWLGPVLLVALIVNLISALLWVCLLRKMDCDLPWAWLLAVWFRSLAGNTFRDRSG